MVTPATSHLDPPKSWEELEEICADLFSREWKDNNATRYGRQGQRQNGVDIYGRPDREKYTAVQCKGRSKWPPDPLTINDIDAEVAKARNFTPKLSEYIIATVDPNDNAVQDYARKITEKHSKTGLFSVHVAAWPELIRRLTQHPDLIKKHYEATSETPKSNKTSKIFLVASYRPSLSNCLRSVQTSTETCWPMLQLWPTRRLHRQWSAISRAAMRLQFNARFLLRTLSSTSSRTWPMPLPDSSTRLSLQTFAGEYCCVRRAAHQCTALSNVGKISLRSHKRCPETILTFRRVPDLPRQNGM